MLSLALVPVRKRRANRSGAAAGANQAELKQPAEYLARSFMRLLRTLSPATRHRAQASGAMEHYDTPTSTTTRLTTALVAPR